MTWVQAFALIVATLWWKKLWGYARLLRKEEPIYIKDFYGRDREDVRDRERKEEEAGH